MPYLSELLATLKFTRLLGQRPFGHYDHDATCVIGPPTCELEGLAAPDLAYQQFANVEEATETVTYEQYTEPRTGEVLYRPVQEPGAGACSS